MSENRLSPVRSSWVQKNRKTRFSDFVLVASQIPQSSIRIESYVKSFMFSRNSTVAFVCNFLWLDQYGLLMLGLNSYAVVLWHETMSLPCTLGSVRLCPMINTGFEKSMYKTTGRRRRQALGTGKPYWRRTSANVDVCARVCSARGGEWINNTAECARCEHGKSEKVCNTVSDFPYSRLMDYRAVFQETANTREFLKISNVLSGHFLVQFRSNADSIDDFPKSTRVVV